MFRHTHCRLSATKVRSGRCANSLRSNSAQRFPALHPSGTKTGTDVTKHHALKAPLAVPRMEPESWGGGTYPADILSGCCERVLVSGGMAVVVARTLPNRLLHAAVKIVEEQYCVSLLRGGGDRK